MRLWQGDIAGYASHSEADMALCNHLAFWCRCDAGKMDAMFRQSGLMRDKWDRKQSGTTYGVMTVQKAIAECRNVYNPKPEYRISIGNSASYEETPRKYTFDDMGNAERLYDFFGGYLRYNYVDKRWYYYDQAEMGLRPKRRYRAGGGAFGALWDAEAKLYTREIPRTSRTNTRLS